MGSLDRWKARIQGRREKDAELESAARIATSGPKNWVSPADIEAFENQMVPWLRKRRQQERRQQK